MCLLYGYVKLHIHIKVFSLDTQKYNYLIYNNYIATNTTGAPPSCTLGDKFSMI